MPSCYFQHIQLPVDQSELQSLQQQATAERLQRAMRYRQDDDKARCLLAEKLLRQALSEQGIAKDKQKIRLTEFGKPVLAIPSESYPPYQPCHFNVSHSGEWVVCAIDNQPIGIDVEQWITDRPNSFQDSDTYQGEYDKLFTSIEIDYLKNGQQDTRQQDITQQNTIQKDTMLQRFYRLWTLKESYLKAIGTGLSRSTQSFSVKVMDNHHAQLWIDGYLQNDWHFYSFEPAKGYICSVCSREKIDINLHSFRFVS